MTARKKAAAKRTEVDSGPKATGTSAEGPLLERVRRIFEQRRGVTEKKMFGGSCFLYRGNMCCGVTKGGQDLMVRVGADAHANALARKHARPMDITGRPMKGFVFVRSAGSRTSAQVRSWVERGFSYAKSLPAK